MCATIRTAERCTERPRTYEHICAGIQERDRLSAIGYFVGRDSRVRMNFRGTEEPTLGRRDLFVQNAQSGL